MEKSKIIYALVWLAGTAFIVALPDRWANKVLGGFWVSIALLTVVIVLLSVVAEGIGILRRRRNIKRNPLDPSLRPLVMSETSWENCAQAPDFCAVALPAFRFLIDEEGFSPARMERDVRALSFRRAEVVVNVGEGSGPSGPEAVVEVILARSADSFRPVAGVSYGSETHELGDGYRGAAYYLRSRLDEIVKELRAEASSSASAG